MSSDTAIKCTGLGKAYAIYRRPEDRLKQMLWSLFAPGKRAFYETFWALEDVTLDVKRGETVGIIGRNGSGKSTFLQIVCGTLTPTCGQLQTNGRIAALLELGAGFNPEFSGRENVYLAASILGLEKQQIDERYQQITDFAGIGDFIEQPVKLYSSGMYARLAFAVAAHVDADILIVDEILSVGDAAFTQKCMRFIRKFQEHGTLFFVSHDTGAVINLCERAVWLDSGTVRGIGSAKDICHEYSVSLQEEQENSNSFKIGGSRRSPAVDKAVQDHRRELLKSSTKRNEIEIFDFDPDAPWHGTRGASIENVYLRTPEGEPLSTLEGGEVVVLHVECTAHQDILKPIVGFYVRDRLGQNLFGDNTYVTYHNAQVPVRSGQRFAAAFRFPLPYLPTGDYSVVAAIAEGTQDDHTAHHWVDDALFFRVHSSHVVRGLVGVPMLEIKFSAL